MKWVNHLFLIIFFFCFRLVLEDRAGKELLESSRLELSEKFDRELYIIRCIRKDPRTPEQGRNSKLTFA